MTRTRVYSQGYRSCKHKHKRNTSSDTEDVKLRCSQAGLLAHTSSIDKISL